MLILEDSALGALARHGLEGYPEEVCGLLIGRTEGEGESGEPLRRVREVRRAANLAPDRRRAFLLDPAEQWRAEMEARRDRREILGVYHSHPDGPALPSAADRGDARSLWGSSISWSYVILEVARGRVASWRSWVLREGSFQEEPLRISDSSRKGSRARRDLAGPRRRIRT